MKRLSGKIALVTGSTRGIGRSIARAFIAEGAEVIIHGRNRDAVEGLARDWGAIGIAADLADESSLDHLLDRLRRDFERLDILVNNAGMEKIMPIGGIERPALNAMWQVNARAPVLLTEGLLPLLRRSGNASVINVTSIHQTTPYPHNAVYSLTKAALGMYSRTAAVELAKDGIRVNNFAPGAVETEINRDVVESMREQFAEWIPAGRCADADEMIGPAVFLASDESSYVTGTTLYADGGYSQNLVRYRPEP